MPTYTYLPDVARLAINRMVAVTEKEKRLLKKALDATIGELVGDYVYRDGTTSMTASWDMGGFNVTNMGDITCDGFTSTGIDDNASQRMMLLEDYNVTWGTNGNVNHLMYGDDKSQIISGGVSSASGGNLRLWGGSHATQANDIAFYEGTNPQLHYDDSASLWDFKANDISTTGTVSGSNIIEQSTGTFTPTIQDTSNSDAEGQTYGVQAGHYIKTGKLVVANIRITVTSIGTLSGTSGARIAGLPFTAATDTNNFASVSVGLANNTGTGAGVITGWISGTQIRLKEWNSHVGAATTSDFTITEYGNTGEIWITATYWTD